MPFLTGWTKEKLITVPAAYIAGSMVDFPLTVQIINDAQIGAAAMANGYDIRFTLSDGTTLLKYERESFAIAAGLANGLFHLRVPSLTSGVAATIYCQYGKADAADGQQVVNTWDAYFRGVWHLGDPGPTTAFDATIRDYDLTQSGGVSFGAAGKVGNAVSLSGSAQYLAKAAAQLISSLSYTISGWIKTSDTSAWIAGKRVAGAGQWGISVGNVYMGDANKATFIPSRGAGLPVVTSSIVVADNAWHHVAGVRVSAENKAYIYIDGAVDGNVTDTNTAVDSATIYTMGAARGTYNDISFDMAGILDEVRLSNIDRSSAWLALEYNCVANQASVVTWGAEQSSAKPPYAFMLARHRLAD